ncbi:MAG: tail fiber domain-containing protein [Ignavibacteriae bacterium]|nr:tail fiber domain-containing protein [Ignavibacteriota bacterium]
MITHQGYLADSAGQGVNATLPMTFRFFADSTGGTALLTQTFSNVQVVKGAFTVVLDVSTLSFSSQRWIETEVNGETIAPRTKLTSVPYALQAMSLVGPGSLATGTDAIAGGTNNRARGNYSVVGGGGGGNVSDSNSAIGDYSTVGGGIYNSAVGTYGTVSGGKGNKADEFWATVGGGEGNIANGSDATISGGYTNIASGGYSTVGGGEFNTASANHSLVSGGYGNDASGSNSMVGGGDNDTASGSSSTVPGGYNNKAGGNYSFAIGAKAKALHDNTFVWNDNESSDFASTGVNQFLIRASGGVGIGTNTPNSMLGIKYNSTNTPHLLLMEDDNDYARLNFQNTSNSNRWSLGGYTAATDASARFSFYYGGVSSGDRMVITGDGKIGIGNSSPGNILTIQQSSATDPIADAWTTYSSRRWKENIKPLEGALEKVGKLQGVSYDWKETGKHDIGLIAEEVGKVIPEVVAYEENGVDAKSVDYARIVALLIEAIKQQQEEIRELKSFVKFSNTVNNEK